MNRSEPTDPVRRIALALLAIIHVLGILGAPFAAKLHLFQPGATPHQNFHVVWEACKYATASLLALAIVLGPLARGERWALWVMVASSIVLFGGVFFSDALTHGGPAIDFWAYGSFLAVSALALGLLAVRDSAPR
ncbi:MAG TPA: hypothetical protein VHU80_14430 [Polyangiaceae bacterium]|jgi:hypothetical protein|nr:hypothetical protein [Polyangiaceae bacterium]